jgi:hypothetical protein
MVAPRATACRVVQCRRPLFAQAWGQVGQVAGLVLAPDLELGRELVDILTAHAVSTSS